MYHVASAALLNTLNIILNNEYKDLIFASIAKLLVPILSSWRDERYSRGSNSKEKNNHEKHRDVAVVWRDSILKVILIRLWLSYCCDHDWNWIHSRGSRENEKLLWGFGHWYWIEIHNVQRNLLLCHLRPTFLYFFFKISRVFLKAQLTP